MRRFAVVEVREPIDPLSGASARLIGFEDWAFGDLGAAMRNAAEKAARTRRPFHVVELVGTQAPVTPDVAWTPAANFHLAPDQCSHCCFALGRHAQGCARR